ncbi:hypothetical protein [Litorivivens sp.]|uniref:hypothetical protein n=1 Tax=Litorivivens sp. TaxID=2020868 RepID=UPI003566671B
MSNVTTALTTLSQRVRYAQKRQLISTRDLASSVRQDPEKLAAWLETTDMSGTVFLAQLADVLSVNLSWLVTGLGSAERLEEELDSSDIELLSVVRNLSPMSRAALLNTAERMLDTEQTYLAQERSSQRS